MLLSKAVANHCGETQAHAILLVQKEYSNATTLASLPCLTPSWPTYIDVSRHLSHHRKIFSGSPNHHRDKQIMVVEPTHLRKMLVRLGIFSLRFGVKITKTYLNI